MARRQAPRNAAPPPAPPRKGMLSRAVEGMFDSARKVTRKAAVQARANFPWAMRHATPVEALDPKFKMPSVAALGPTGNARFARQVMSLARHAYRNDANIARGLSMVIAGIVGQGPMPCSPFPELQGIIRNHLPDIHNRGRFSWGGLCSAIMTMDKVDGECFVRARPRRLTDGLTLPLQLELIEAEQVAHELTLVGENGNRVVTGIELDSLDRPAAYWMWPVHPLDGLMQSVSNGQAPGIPAPVPAASVFHVAKPVRPNSLRGDSALTSCIVRLYNLHNYEFAEATRKHVSTLVTGWITRPAGEEGTALPGEHENPDPNAKAQTEIALEAGLLTELPAGTEIKWNNPPDTGQSYEPYVRFALQYIAAAVGSTYEDFTGDWRGANDRTWRAAQVALRQYADQERDRFEQQFLKPLYRQLVDLAIGLGLWTPPAGTPDWQVYQCRWSWPAAKNPNQYQEGNAVLLLMQAGLKSRDEAIEELGGDPVEVDTRMAEGKARAEAMNLYYSAYLPPAPGAVGGLGAFFEGIIGGLVKAQVEEGLRQRLADVGGTEMDRPADNPRAVAGDNGGPPLEDDGTSDPDTANTPEAPGKAP